MYILSLKAIKCLSVCLCICLCVRFFGLINFKIGRQLLLGPLNTKQNFFLPQTLPLPYPSPKGKFSRNINYSSTLWWIQLKLSDNLSYTHTQLLEKNLSRTSHLNWVITQPLLKYVKFWFLYFCALTPPRRLKISTSHFQLCIPLLHKRF